MSMKSEMARSHAGMRYVMCAAIIGAVVCIAQSASLAQGTLSAGSVSAGAGGTAVVPITLTLPAELTGATMQFKLTVVPGTGSPPAIDTQVTFDTSVAATSQNIANGLNSRLVGWFANFSPLLTGTTVMGNLSVPIPAGAAAASTYTVQVLNPSGTSDVDNTIDLIPSPVNGTITVTGGATATPTSTSTPQVVLPTSTPTSTPKPTATATKAGGTATPTTGGGGVCPTCEDDDGCQIGARGHGFAWLVLVPAIGLLVVRRRRR
jgi:hypothetical protein